jgi:hypothetical protein
MSRSILRLCAWPLLGLAALALPAGCGSGGDSGVENPVPQVTRAVPQSDLEIARLLYTDSARTPADFYSEPPPASGYAATFHIKNSDLKALIGAADPVHELCTDDWNEALGWSEAVAASEPAYSDLTSTNTSEQYYEFVRTRRTASLAIEQMRVYRCAFLDRNGADIARLTGAAGHLNKRPLEISDVQWTLEYLWRFSAYNNVDNVVLKSAPLAAGASPAHELILAALSHGTGTGACDRVRVFAWSYRTDATSGQLSSEQRELWTFDARNDRGSVELCGR